MLSFTVTANFEQWEIRLTQSRRRVHENGIVASCYYATFLDGLTHIVSFGLVGYEFFQP